MTGTGCSILDFLELGKCLYRVIPVQAYGTTSRTSTTLAGFALPMIQVLGLEQSSSKIDTALVQRLILSTFLWISTLS